MGILPNTEMYRGVVDLDEAGYVIAGEDGVTSCAGIFAAGDCVPSSFGRSLQRLPMGRML